MITFKLGIYKTYRAAEEAAKLWVDIYGEEALSIVHDGHNIYLVVTLPDDPR